MKMTGLGLALALSIASLATAGCNPKVTCESYCQDRTTKGCANVPKDCSTTCTDTTAAVAAGSCDSLYTNFLDCADTSENTCSVGNSGDTQCIAEVQQLKSCLGAYCTTNPKAQGCVGGAL